MLLSLLLLVVRYLLYRDSLEITFRDSYPFSQEHLLHAVATPLTILKNCNHQDKRVIAAVDSIHQLVTSFSLPNTFSKRCELKKIVHEVAILISTKEQQVHVLMKKELWLNQVNQVRLKEALLCLIRNALEASTSLNETVFVIVQQKQSDVFISIVDNGIGMNSWQQLVAHWPLITFKKTGTGYGLHYARRVIETELKGKLYINSKLGCGSMITCRIPVNR